MKIIELRNLHKPREGARVTMEPDPAVRIDAGEKKLVLPLGRSLRKLLKGDENHPRGFDLKWGDLHPTNAGLVLVAQTDEENREDGRALVLITAPTDSTLGQSIDYEEDEPNNSPQVIENRVLVFLPGNRTRLVWNGGDGRVIRSSLYYNEGWLSAR